jgi:hypothetical protein
VLLVLAVAVYAVRSETPVSSAPTPEPSPTATVSPTQWRLDGTVIDAQGRPIEGVCVGVGPAVCTDVNPRTDARGKWHIDLPKVSVDYDFHFTKDGYKPFETRIRPVTHQEFTITMSR